MVVMLSLLVGVATSGTPLPLTWFVAATAYARDPVSLIGDVSVSMGGPGGQCLGVLLDSYHIYSTTVGLVVSTVTFSTQKYAFGCVQLDVTTVTTTSALTTGTTATQTLTQTQTTTTVLQVQVQGWEFALIVLLLFSMVPLLARTAVKAQRIYRERRALRAAGVLQGIRVQDLNNEDWEKREKGRRRVLR
jgi:hypothetical protein